MQQPNSSSSKASQLRLIVHTGRVYDEVPTLAALLEQYLADRKPGQPTQKRYRYLLKRHCADWMDMPLSDITGEMVVVRHQAISHDTPATANFVLRIISSLFNYALNVVEDSQGNMLLSRNPVHKLSALRGWNPEVSRVEEFIEIKNIPAWWHAVQTLQHTTRDYFIFLLLTGVRSLEASSLKWQDVDLESGIVYVGRDPERATKNGRMQRVALSDYLWALLRARKLRSFGSPYVFPGPNSEAPIQNPYRAVRTVKALSKVDWKPHSLRRTFINLVTLPGLKLDEATLKALLNHSAGSDVTVKHYLTMNTERLRIAYQSVTDHVLELVGAR